MSSSTILTKLELNKLPNPQREYSKFLSAVQDQGIPDHFTTLKIKINQYLYDKRYKRKFTDDVFKKLVHVLTQIRQPAELLDSTVCEKIFKAIDQLAIEPKEKNLFTRTVKGVKDVMNTQTVTLTPDSSLFAPLNTLLLALDKILQEMKGNKKLKNLIVQLIDEYKNYQEAICSKHLSLEMKKNLLVPMAYVQGRDIGPYWMPITLAQEYFNRDFPDPKHPVTEKDGIYFKSNSSNDIKVLEEIKARNIAHGLEDAAAGVYLMMGGQGATHSTLLKITYPGQSPNELNLVQASKAAPGEILETVLRRDESVIINRKSSNFTPQFFADLVVCSGDGKPNNQTINLEDARFLLTSFDNDEDFVNEIYQYYDSQIKANVYGLGISSVLYCFPHMEDTIDPAFRKYFLKKGAEYFLFTWLKDRFEFMDYYKQAEIEGIFTKKELEIANMPPKFQQPLLIILYNRLLKMEAFLKKNENATHDELFKEIYPTAQKHYQDCRKKAAEKQAASAVYISAIEEAYYLAIRTNIDLTEAEQKALGRLPNDKEPQKTSDVNELLAYFLINYSFDEIDSTRQQKILSYLSTFHSMESLHIKNCDDLNETYLRDMKDHFPHLKKLTLENCTSVTERGLIALLSRKEPLEFTFTLGEENKGLPWESIDIVWEEAKKKHHQISIITSTYYPVPLDVQNPTLLRNMLDITRNPILFDVLIKNGAELNSLDEETRTPLHYIVRFSDGLETIKILIAAGADLNAKSAPKGNKQAETALQKAIAYGQTMNALALLYAGAETDLTEAKIISTCQANMCEGSQADRKNLEETDALLKEAALLKTEMLKIKERMAEEKSSQQKSKAVVPNTQLLTCRHIYYNTRWNVPPIKKQEPDDEEPRHHILLNK